MSNGSVSSFSDHLTSGELEDFLDKEKDLAEKQPRDFLRHSGCDKPDCLICMESGRNISISEFRKTKNKIKERMEMITGGNNWKSLLQSQILEMGFNGVSEKTVDVKIKDHSSIKIVDIFMSAGKYEKMDYGDENDGYRSCHPTNNIGNCSIYRVRWGLEKGQLISVEKVKGNSLFGYTQPALSPDGTLLAYKYTRYIATSSDSRALNGVKDSGIEILHLLSGESEKIVQKYPRMPFHFPNWYDDDTLLYHESREDSPMGDLKTLYSVSVLFDEGNETFDIGRAVRLNNRVYNYSDANTEKCVDNNNCQRRVVAHGKEPGEVNATPKVFVMGGVREPESFEVAFDGDNLPDCHHASWNISGDRIQCSGQGFNSEFNLPEGFDGMPHKLIFGYRWHDVEKQWVRDNSSNNSHGALFEPKTPEMLSQFFSPGKTQRSLFPIKSFVFPFAYSESEKKCDIIVYKYAEWCGTDDYIVVTVYCSSFESNSRDHSDNVSDDVLVSRIIVVHLPSSEYWDLTKVIQSNFFYGQNVRINGVYATCSNLLSFKY